MDAITHKVIFGVFTWTFACLVAIFTWYVVTVCLWLAYKGNGGKAPYLRYLKIKKLHITNLR